MQHTEFLAGKRKKTELLIDSFVGPAEMAIYIKRTSLAAPRVARTSPSPIAFG